MKYKVNFSERQPLVVHRDQRAQLNIFISISSNLSTIVPARLDWGTREKTYAYGLEFSIYILLTSKIYIRKAQFRKGFNFPHISWVQFSCFPLLKFFFLIRLVANTMWLTFRWLAFQTLVYLTNVLFSTTDQISENSFKDMPMIWLDCPNYWKTWCSDISFYLSLTPYEKLWTGHNGDINQHN